MGSKWRNIATLVLSVCFLFSNAFSQGVIMARKGEHWGVVSADGTVLQAFQFEDYQWLRGVGFAVYQRGKWGVLNRAGHMIVPVQYDEVSAGTKEGYAFIKVKVHAFPDREVGYWGVFNTHGQQVLPVQYNYVEYEGDGLFRVATDTVPWQDGSYSFGYGRWGMFDTLGRERIPITYTSCNYHKGIGRLSTDRDKASEAFFHADWGLFDASAYAFAFYLSDGLFCAQRDGKFGVVNWQHEVKVPFEYDYIYPYGEGDLLAVQKGHPIEEGFTNLHTLASMGGRWGVIRLDGSSVLPLEYDRVRLLSDRLIAVNKGFQPKERYGARSSGADGHWGVKNAADETLLPVVYSVVQLNKAGLLTVRKTNRGDWHLYDHTGKSVTTYSRRARIVFPDDPGSIMVCQDAFVLRLIMDGAVVASMKDVPFDRPEKVYELDAGVLVRERGGWVLFEPKQKAQILQRANLQNNGDLLAKTENGWGLFSGGNGSIPLTYDSLFFASEKLLWARSGTRWSLLDQRGRALHSENYARVFPLVDDLAVVSIGDEPDAFGGFSNERFGVINQRGEVQIPLQYLRIKSFGEGIFAAQETTAQGYPVWKLVNDRGHELSTQRFAQVGGDRSERE